MPTKQIGNACITINNTHQLPPNVDTTNVIYYIFGKEIAPTTGTRHLQGYVEFRKLMTYTQIKRALKNNSIHIEGRRGTQEQAIAYCKKEDPEPFIYGEPKKNGRPKGSKTTQINEELSEVVDMLNAGDSVQEIMVKEPAFYYRYKSYIEDYDHNIKDKQQKEELSNWAETVVLNPRQRELIDAIENQNDRQITWIFDPIGNTGKSFWSKYMIVKYKAIRFTNAKTADLAYAYNGEPIVIIDLSRSTRDRVNYGAIEDLKNGMLFSGKYKSKTKIFSRAPKIIILTNVRPNLSAMSRDRWDIRDWSGL